MKSLDVLVTLNKINVKYIKQWRTEERNRSSLHLVHCLQNGSFFIDIAYSKQLTVNKCSKKT